MKRHLSEDMPECLKCEVSYDNYGLMRIEKKVECVYTALTHRER